MLKVHCLSICVCSKEGIQLFVTEKIYLFVAYVSEVLPFQSFVESLCFPIEISSVTFAAIFAGSHSTLTFTERRRDKLYQKYLKDKISIHKITIFHLRIQSQKIYDHSYMYLIIT